MTRYVCSRVQVSLAQGNPSAALALLESLRQHVKVRGWAAERRTMLVEALAHRAHGATVGPVQLLGEAVALAAPDGFIRHFVDEGMPSTRIFSEAAARGRLPRYIGTLLAVVLSAT